jgi:hypothetical protein
LGGLAGVDTPGSREGLQINNIGDRTSGYRNTLLEYAKNMGEIIKQRVQLLYFWTLSIVLFL